MPPWFGTLIVLSLVGAMVVLLVLSIIRNKKRGKGCCGACSRCKFQCSAKQELHDLREKKKD